MYNNHRLFGVSTKLFSNYKRARFSYFRISMTHQEKPSLVCAFLFSFSLIPFLLNSLAHADCTGCCSYHGGVVCSGGVTKCSDGSALSSKCLAKGCNRCPTNSAVTPRNSNYSTQQIYIKGLKEVAIILIAAEVRYM